jgi:hypothetical protein
VIEEGGTFLCDRGQARYDIIFKKPAPGLRCTRLYLKAALHEENACSTGLNHGQ